MTDSALADLLERPLQSLQKKLLGYLPLPYIDAELAEMRAAIDGLRGGFPPSSRVRAPFVESTAGIASTEHAAARFSRVPGPQPA